jgi:hypothetical protein
MLVCSSGRKFGAGFVDGIDVVCFLTIEDEKKEKRGRRSLRVGSDTDLGKRL